MIERFFAKLDKAHMVVGIFMFGAGTALQYYHRLDASYVAFASATFSYLGAHLYLNGNPATDPSNNDTPTQ